MSGFLQVIKMGAEVGVLEHICFPSCPSSQAACYVRAVGDDGWRSGSCSDLHSEGFDAGIYAFCLFLQRKWIRLTLLSVPRST